MKDNNQLKLIAFSQKQPETKSVNFALDNEH